MFIILISVVASQLLVNIWMFYAKAGTRCMDVAVGGCACADQRAILLSANCCAELRLILDSGPDGGACPPVGLCRGFEGNCGDLADQFSTLPVLPDFPKGLQEWECTAFPDDENKARS